MIDYSLILSVNYAGKQWTLNGDNYEGLTWLDSSTKPTQTELDSLWESTQTQVTNEKAQTDAIKTSAQSKLSALGLTTDEVKALLGIQ